MWIFVRAVEESNGGENEERRHFVNAVRDLRRREGFFLVFKEGNSWEVSRVIKLDCLVEVVAGNDDS